MTPVRKPRKGYGCAQVLWLDRVERKYVEEVGANVFFVIEDTVVTPCSAAAFCG